MLRAKKKWGQNFLCDSQLALELIDAIHPTGTDTFIEIGPGKGALTKHLVGRSENVMAVEIDPDCVNFLQSRYPSLVIFNQNILSIDWSVFGAGSMKRIVGNLPYYISSELLELFCNNYNKLLDVHIMLQKEVADRILSRPGDKSFSRLSIFVQSYFDVEHLIDVKPEYFSPVPSVRSSFVRLVTKSHPEPIDQNCHAIIKAAFSQRRKMIRNSLSSFFSDSDFLAIGIPGNKRAQEISRREYEAMSSFLSQIGKNR